MGIVQGAEANDIDGRVDRLLADLKGIRPPLPLNVVCELLKLDLRYYTAADVSTFDGLVHKMRIARHQVGERPRLLWEVIQKLELKGLWLPDQKRIAIAADLPAPKKRWAHAHELVHSLLPWHETFMHGDQHRTLREDCHSTLEAEANYGASRLLFLGRQFDPVIASKTLAFGDLQRVAKQFGNSLASTHRRCVNHALDIVAGAVSVSPWSGDGNAGKVRHMFSSPAFRDRFGECQAEQMKGVIDLIVERKRAGPCGEGEVLMPCKRGETHVFHVACFNNQHSILTTVVYMRPHTSLG